MKRFQSPRILQSAADRGFVSGELLAKLLEFDKARTKPQRVGDPYQLLRAAIGCQAMERDDVPVADTLEMARQLEQRVNFNWSRRRWIEMHNKCIERINELAESEDDEMYDISEFEELLPERFRPYLVRSRQQLSRIGRQQHHCVGSYHHSVMAGRCAFVHFLIKDKWWTVQLVQPPLRIREIRGKCNQLPTQQEQEWIHQLLKIQRKSALKTAQFTISDLKGEYGCPEGMSYWRDSIVENAVGPNLAEVIGALTDLKVESMTHYSQQGETGELNLPKKVDVVPAASLDDTTVRQLRHRMLGSSGIKLFTHRAPLMKACAEVAEAVIEDYRRHSIPMNSNVQVEFNLNSLNATVKWGPRKRDQRDISIRWIADANEQLLAQLRNFKTES